MRSRAAASSRASGRPSSAADDRDHVGEGVVVDIEPGAYGRRPLGEQAHRRRAAGLGHPRVRVGQCQRAERHQRLAVDRERFPAGGQHPQAGAARQQRRDQVRDGVDEVLAVVHHEQAFAAVELVGEDVELAALGPHPAALEQRGAAESDRGQHGRTDLGRFGHRGQIDQPGAVPVLVTVAAAGLQRQPGLARAARPEHGDQAPGGEQPLDPGEVVVAADEAGQGGRQIAHRGLRGRGGRGRDIGGAQQAQVALTQGGAGIGAEAVGEVGPYALVQLQGLRLAALGGHRVHQQPGDPLVGGVLGQQRGQPPGGRVGPAQPQLGLGQVRAGLDRDPGQPDRDPGGHRGDRPPARPTARPPDRAGAPQRGGHRLGVACGRRRPVVRTATRRRRRR